LVISAALFFALGLFPGASAEPRVTPGLDVLRAEGADFLSGRRIGLISNPTGQTIDGVSTLRVLRGELGVSVKVLPSTDSAATPLRGTRSERTARP
jgi:uncharacterized protein YbbC (DUF1343 family)